MTKQRTERLNSLLREVISGVIRTEVRNPKIPQLLSVTRVEITKDLSFAKVYISFIGEGINTQEAIHALQSASGFIGTAASKQVVMRTFPTLKFVLDDSVSKQMRIEELLTNLNAEAQNRTPTENHDVTEPSSES
jgi:ribosome-binding factor A